MDKRRKRVLQSASTFSMSHLRDIVDRTVSGFFYGSEHAPECAKRKIVAYEKCFSEMTMMSRYQNVASRMFAGHFAYDGHVRLCLEEDSEGCEESLSSVLAGTCNLNFIIMTEVSQSSILLLFETLPWVRPTLDFFPVVQDIEESATTDEGPRLQTTEHVVWRRNVDAKHEEGIKHITPELREAARSANPVDDVLHEFVSAMFCFRLRETGLLQHPLVKEELGTNELLHERCTDNHWVETTLEYFQRLVPDDCRLYQPFARS